jgi:hypothetical protein
MPEEEAVALFSTCVEPERSDAVKICVVKACLILEQEVTDIEHIVSYGTVTDDMQ